MALKQLCKLMFVQEDYEATVIQCTSAIESSRVNADADLDEEEEESLVQLYIFRAYAHLSSQQYTSAASDVKLARRIRPHDVRLMQLQRRIQLAECGAGAA